MLRGAPRRRVECTEPAAAIRGLCSMDLCSDGPRRCGRRSASSKGEPKLSSLDQHLEAAIDHALAVERHPLAVHHGAQPLVLHYFGVDAVAMSARLESYPREYHRLVRLELDATWKRRPFADFHVVGDAFAELERAVLTPDLAGLARHAPVVVQTLLRHRHHESIDIGHPSTLLAYFAAGKRQLMQSSSRPP